MFTKNLWQVNDVSLLRHAGDVANTRAPGVTAGFPVKSYLGSRMRRGGRTVTQSRQVSSVFRSVLVQNVSVCFSENSTVVILLDHCNGLL